MVGAKWSAIFPLRVGGFVSLSDRDPAVFADGAAWFRISLLEPRNYERGLGLKLTMGHVVIRQRAIKRVLFRNERDRDVVPSRARIGRIESAVIRGPRS